MLDLAVEIMGMWNGGFLCQDKNQTWNTNGTYSFDQMSENVGKV